MKYVFLIKIKVPKYKYFIELSKNYELNFHPNIKDEIVVDEFFCSITQILHFVDDDKTLLYLNVNDPQHVVKNSKEAIRRLIYDIEELKIYDWHLGDYFLGKHKI